MKGKKDKNQILAPVRLVYFSRPDKKSGIEQQEPFLCAMCFKTSYIIGSMNTAIMPHEMTCLNCAEDRYKEYYGFKTIEQARARRQRMFDISHRFTELIFERLCYLRGTIPEDDSSTEDFELAQLISSTFWNDEKFITREEKIDLEDEVSPAFIDLILGDRADEVIEDLEEFVENEEKFHAKHGVKK